jgi:RNA polymerase sigma-70 factor, ECF subfamily
MEKQAAEFTTLVDRYSRRVFNLAFRITGSRQDAEDVVQDTFLQCFRGMADFRGESDVFTWIYRIALNASLKVRRKIGNEASIDKLEEDIESFREDVPEEVRQWIADPAKAAYMQALLSEINQGCLHFMTFRLTDQQRVVYVMRAILDFTYQEIAAVLEVPESVVKSRLHRAHAKLEKYFSSRCQWCDPDHATCSC